MGNWTIRKNYTVQETKKNKENCSGEEPMNQLPISRQKEMFLEQDIDLHHAEVMGKVYTLVLFMGKARV